tara:strand:+ start:934 stop:1182 length:249 start_codon:yes stop_codon:yes gene_type:complete
MNNFYLEEFEKNLKRIKINETNKNISKKLDDISYKIKELSLKLNNNMNNNDNIVARPAPAGHTLPVFNNSHLHFSRTLRRFW